MASSHQWAKHELEELQNEVEASQRWQRTAFDKVRAEIEKLSDEGAKEVLKTAFKDACHSSWRMTALSSKSVTVANREFASKENYRKRLQALKKWGDDPEDAEPPAAKRLAIENDVHS